MGPAKRQSERFARETSHRKRAVFVLVVALIGTGLVGWLFRVG